MVCLVVKPHCLVRQQLPVSSVHLARCQLAVVHSVPGHRGVTQAELFVIVLIVKRRRDWDLPERI